MSPLTLYLGRVGGLFCLLMCLIVAGRPKAALQAINAVAESPGLLLITGASTLAAGVAWVVGHNLWSGGFLPVAVTLLGWLTLIKGAVLIAMPSSGLKSLYRVLHYPQAFRLVMLVGAALGAWLAWTAFRA